MTEYVPLFKAGKAITLLASAPIAGGQLLRISGSGAVAPTTAASADWLGVAGHDASTGDQVTVYREGIQRLAVSPAGTITAGQTVEGAANGQVAAHTIGSANDLTVTVGLALTTGTPGSVIEVSARR